MKAELIKLNYIDGGGGMELTIQMPTKHKISILIKDDSDTINLSADNNGFGLCVIPKSHNELMIKPNKD